MKINKRRYCYNENVSNIEDFIISFNAKVITLNGEGNIFKLSHLRVKGNENKFRKINELINETYKVIYNDFYSNYGIKEDNIAIFYTISKI